MRFQNIDTERIRLGLTKEALAKQLNITVDVYCKWLNGINAIPSESLVALSQICHSSIDYLLDLENIA